MSKSLNFFLFIIDIILLNGSILFAWNYYANNPIFIEHENILYLLVYSNLSWLFLIIISNPYRINRAWSISKIVKSQTAFFLIHLFVITSLIIFFKQDYSLTQIGLTYLIFMPLFFIVKIAIFYFRRTFSEDLTIKNYILIGKNELSYKLREYYLANPEDGRKFCGYFDDFMNNLSIERIKSFCLEKKIHEIYCCIPNVQRTKLIQLVEFGLNSLIKVKLILSFSREEQHSIQFVQHDKKPYTEVTIIPLDGKTNQIIKRTFDVLFSFLVIIFVLLWIIPIIGLIIQLDSPGSIFFSQKRSGKNNNMFRCLKFRTMHINEEADYKVSSANDSRITKFGFFLRTTHLDELPQFINVFLGTMSVVGPRPHMLKVTKDYNQLIKKFMGRHYIKPGITGLAQCMGYSGDKTGNPIGDLVDMENRVKMDFYYIENWSFILDIKIIFLTIIRILRRNA